MKRKREKEREREKGNEKERERKLREIKRNFENIFSLLSLLSSFYL
jgi:hypothetical protein